MQQFISAEQSKSLYLEKKEQILKILQEAIGFYEQEENGQDRAEALASLQQSLVEGTFGIVVVGEFSSGKSTLLNALMGQQILPSFTGETTATVNFLRHRSCAQNGQAATVFHTDGTQVDLETVDIDTIHQYATTKGDGVAQKIAHLDLYLDSPFLEDGVTLVDSPGLNGVAEGHREITQQQILKSHASIFLFSSDHPGTKTDFEFLHELQKKVQTIIFVLNKIDVIRQEENETPETVIQNLKNNYKKQFPDLTSIPEIWPLAARPAMLARSSTKDAEEQAALEASSQLAPFENRLMSFLTNGEKNRQAMLAPLEKVLELALETKQDFALQTQALEGELDGQVIDDQIHALESQMETLEEDVRKIRTEVSKQMTMLYQETNESLTVELKQLETQKIRSVENCTTWEELCHTTDDLAGWFSNRTQQILLDCEATMEDGIRNMVEGQYSNLLSDMENALNLEREEFSLKTTSNIRLPDQWSTINLEKMDQHIQETEVAIEVLEAQQDQAYRDLFTARLQTHEKEKLEFELASLRQQKQTAQTMYIPATERYARNVEEKVWREGLFGGIGNLFFGRKTVQRSTMATDDTARNEALDERTRTVKAIDEQLEKVARQKDEIMVGDPDYLAYQAKQQAAKTEGKRREFLHYQEKMETEIMQQHDRAVRTWRNTVSEFCETLSSELLRQVRKSLQRTKKEYCDIVCQMVASNLRHTLEKKQAELERLQLQRNGAVEERTQQLATLAEKERILMQIMGKASDLSVEIGAQQADAVQQSRLEETAQ